MYWREYCPHSKWGCRWDFRIHFYDGNSNVGLSHKKRTRQLLGEGTLLFLSTIKWVQNSQQRKKRRRRKKKRQPNSWLLVCGIHKYKAKWEDVSWHDCHIPKETTNVFTNEEHTLQWQPSPKEVALMLLAHKWKGPARSCACCGRWKNPH